MYGFIVFFVMVFCSTANAEVYVLVNENKEILSISSQDDAVVEEGMQKVVLQGDIADYNLTMPATMYKLSGKKIVQNNKKITEQEEEINRMNFKAEMLERAEKASLLKACEDLKAAKPEINCDDLK